MGTHDGRLLTYLSLLYEDIIRNNALTPSGKLRSVLVLVVYNGNQPWRAARDLESLIEQAPGASRSRDPGDCRSGGDSDD